MYSNVVASTLSINFPFMEKKKDLLKQIEKIFAAIFLMSIGMLTSPWFKYFFTYDPQSDLRKVKCPVLAITGDKDVQAPSTDNLHNIENALLAGGNKNVIVKSCKDETICFKNVQQV
jgi:hypothetical protein